MTYDKANLANTKNKKFIVRDPAIDFEFSYLVSKRRQNRWRNRLLVAFILLIVSLGFFLPIIIHYQVDHVRAIVDSSSYRLMDSEVFTPMLDETPMMDEKIRFGKTNVAKSEVKSRKIKVATF
jgi:hypothetical protein